ncbi:MAG: LpqB family beta-propeller domain-containing protein [Acidobacteriota bacterium]
MRRFLAPLLGLCAFASSPARAQTRQPTPAPSGQELEITIRKEALRRLAVAVPELLPTGTAALTSAVVGPFTATLRSDVEYAEIFVLADPALYPAGMRDPTAPDAGERWLSGGAEILLDTRADVSGDRVTIEGRVWDLKSRKMILGRRYTGGASYVSRIAHTLANDLVKYFTGKDGLYLSTIAFVSDRDKNKEIYAMDFDGRNVRQLTAHRSLSINPNGRGGRIVYTSYVHTFPQIYSMNVDGSDKREIPTGLDLNASPAISPDGSQIVFAGSQRGNTDIYVVGVNGGNLRRLTNTRSLEAAPEWSPTGRQILYTSDQTGVPQIWLMDAEGTGARQFTFAGNWNDEGTWSPDGARIAFACRNEGDFNICVMDIATGRTVQLTAEGSNSHPAWSPDGGKIVYQSRRGGSTQIYTMDAGDGKNKRLLSDAGNNTQPVWLP